MIARIRRVLRHPKMSIRYALIGLKKRLPTYNIYSTIIKEKRPLLYECVCWIVFLEFWIALTKQIYNSAANRRHTSTVYSYRLDIPRVKDWWRGRVLHENVGNGATRAEMKTDRADCCRRRRAPRGSRSTSRVIWRSLKGKRYRWGAECPPRRPIGSCSIYEWQFSRFLFCLLLSILSLIHILCLMIKDE